MTYDICFNSDFIWYNSDRVTIRCVSVGIFFEHNCGHFLLCIVYVFFINMWIINILNMK
jgi:hypothetical protein